MGDNVTPSSAVVPQVITPGVPTSELTFLQLPPSIQQQKQIAGEVVSVKDGQVTIKTPQGLVSFETDAALQVGQKVLLRLQNPALQLQVTTAAQIMIQSERGEIKPAPLVQQPKIQETVPAPSVTVSPVFVEQEETANIQNIKSLPLQLALLPQKLSDTGQNILLKQVLNLSPQQPLPPPLLEALTKIQELSVTLKSSVTQSRPPTAEGVATVTPVPEPQLVEQILNVLQGKTPVVNSATLQAPISPEKNIALPGNSLSPVGQPLVETMTGEQPLPLPQQTARIVAAIPPGTPVTPEMLQEIIQSAGVPLKQTSFAELPKGQTPLLVLLLGSQPAPLAQPAAPVMANNFQQTLLQVQQQAQVSLENPASQTSKNNPAAPTFIPGATPGVQEEITVPVMALVTLPEGKQALSLVQIPSATARAALPGTVLVMASPEKMITALPTLPMIAVPEKSSLDSFMPFHPSMSKDWGALQLLWQEMQSTNAVDQLLPQAATALRQMMPTLNPQQFTPAVLFFMAITKNNLSLPWLDEERIAGLPAEKANLLLQLSRDINAIKSALNDTAAPEAWRPLPVPLHVGEQLVRLQFFYRQHTDDLPGGQEETLDDKRKRRKTRFLLDVPQTRLGDIQIDGLVQPKQLDIILRTESTLQAYQRVAISERFQAALDVTGLAGGISYQYGSESYVRV